jgi:choline-glycine betaine transporter
VRGWPGHIIDIVAVLATISGLATSLGFGASQAAVKGLVEEQRMLKIKPMPAA